MTAVASEGLAGTRHQLRQRLRSTVLGPRGGGIAVAVAATAIPYLSRPVHRLVSLLVTLAVLAGICGGQALPVNAISSVVLGWGVAAALHLAVGSPLGLPSAAEITEWITDLRIRADITRAPRQVWGIELDPVTTAYLPPVWGWATLAWMRRREYV